MQTGGFDFTEVIGIIFYAAFINLIYSMGIVLEVINIHYLKSALNLFHFRYFFYNNLEHFFPQFSHGL